MGRTSTCHYVSCSILFEFELIRNTLSNTKNNLSCMIEVNTVCTMNCSHFCIPHPEQHCACRSGFELDGDGRKCNRINYCNSTTHPHKCTQLCESVNENESVGYTCKCTQGYALLGDNTTCVGVLF